MNFFSKSKKTSQSNEEPVIVESVVQDASISDSASLLMPREEKEKLETVHEIHKEAEYIEETPIFEYSSSFLESISFNMYSESTQNEIKKTVDITKNAVFSAWSKMKDAYKYVAELNEECIAEELESSTNDGNYYSNVGLDVSI